MVDGFMIAWGVQYGHFFAEWLQIFQEVDVALAFKVIGQVAQQHQQPQVRVYLDLFA